MFKYRNFSTTVPKKADPGSIIASAATATASPFLDPVIGGILYGSMWLLYLVVITTSVVGGDIGIQEIPADFDIPVGAIDIRAEATGGLIGLIGQGAEALRDAMGAITMTTVNVHNLHIFYASIVAIHVGIDGLASSTEVAHDIPSMMGNGLFGITNEFFLDIREAAIDTPELGETRDDLDRDIDYLREAGNAIVALMRRLEEILDVDTNSTPASRWFE